MFILTTFYFLTMCHYSCFQNFINFAVSYKSFFVDIPYSLLNTRRFHMKKFCEQNEIYSKVIQNIERFNNSQLLFIKLSFLPIQGTHCWYRTMWLTSRKKTEKYRANEPLFVNFLKVEDLLTESFFNKEI